MKSRGDINLRFQGSIDGTVRADVKAADRCERESGETYFDATRYNAVQGLYYPTL
jgi:hypothetical protein